LHSLRAARAEEGRQGMTQSLIMRDRSVHLTDVERAAATKALECAVRGIDEKNHKSWCRFLRELFGLEDGEIAEVGTRMPRSGPFHRYHMAVEQAVFDAQERFNDFEQFRNWLKIGAAFVTWVPGPKGGIVPLPKSIAYASIEEDEMRKVHASILDFLHGAHAAPYLWRHLDREEAGRMMKSILEGFDQ